MRTLVRRPTYLNPWGYLWGDFDKVFDEFFGNELKLKLDSEDSRYPIADENVMDDKYEMTFEVPGVEPENVSVEKDGNYLKVSVNQEKEEKSESRYSKRSFNFSKVVELPNDAVAEDVKVVLKSGILTVTLPRKALEEKKPEVKKIPISTQ